MDPPHTCTQYSKISCWICYSPCGQCPFFFSTPTQIPDLLKPNSSSPGNFAGWSQLHSFNTYWSNSNPMPINSRSFVVIDFEITWLFSIQFLVLPAPTSTSTPTLPLSSTTHTRTYTPQIDQKQESDYFDYFLPPFLDDQVYSVFSTIVIKEINICSPCFFDS